MANKIFRFIFLAAVCSVALASALIMLTLYQSYARQLENQLKTEAGFLQYALSRQTDEAGYLSGFFPGNRITLIAPDGQVLYDSTVDAGDLGNHLSRPEVQAALKSGSGETHRYSSTLSEVTLYYAVRTDDGNVLRLSNVQSSVLGLLIKILPYFVGILLAVAVISSFAARIMARNIVRPINTLNLDAPLENDVYDELGPLLSRMNHQRKELSRRMAELTENKREFAAITQRMREGMVLLSGRGDILSINESGANIFDVDPADFIGRPLLSISRSAALEDLLNEAARGENARTELAMGGRHYQLLASPVDPQNTSRGTLVLALDVTDRQSAERSRREFSANVSHELKTPLTSISGYAEIMKSGMADPGDMRGFAERIHDEATRLIELISDVIKLSRLDEQAGLPEKVRINLLDAAQAVGARLTPLAGGRQIDLSVSGAPLEILGYAKILDEMIYNLLDNAIKYNKTGGRVEIRVRADGELAVLDVSDTGIGIPQPHQDRVFERFYRVDQSHARDTGGTGLGLSIVKHGAAAHGARLSLKSAQGEGTQISLAFPLARRAEE